MAIATTNPATGEMLERYTPLTDMELAHRLDRAAAGARALRQTSADDRSAWLEEVAEILDAEESGLARLITTETGKPISGACAEVAKCATALRYFAAHGPRFLAEEPADPEPVDARRALVRYEPLGPVLAIMPWNFPMWQVIRFAAPALIAGNPVLLKPAPNVPQTGLLLAELFARGGFPPGSFQTLLLEQEQVEPVIADPRVRGVTLTGGTRAGRAVAATAGQYLKKTVLELGGSDPFLVMPSAELDTAVATAVRARCQNNGQSCIAAKRFLVHSDVYEPFVDRFVAAMTALTVGDPTDSATQLGPLATEAGRAEVAAQVRDAVAHGATVRCGGTVPEGPGWWYPPTVLTDLHPGMRIWQEEVFGPVAAVHRVGSYSEAVEVANGTPYGLGASAWTTDPREQERFVADLEFGAVFVNGMVTSYPSLPFGGVKDSGYGRELAAQGVREFCNVKTIWIG